MTRIIWQMIKDQLINPYLDVDLKYYDLSIESRDETDDQITIDAANATKQYGVAVKCATITPDEARVEEFDLKKMWRSPNGTIRNILGGVVFREPIVINNVPRLVPGWTQPVVVGRHAFGDQYKATDFLVPGAGKLTMKWEAADGSDSQEYEVFDFPEAGIAMGMYNLDQSIRDFARASMNYGLQRKWPVYLSTKNTIMKKYDGRFKDIFQEVFDAEFKDAFAEFGGTYEHRLIDDMVAAAMKWFWRFMFGPVRTMMATCSLTQLPKAMAHSGLMTSVLMTPDGKTVEAEAAHGTVTPSLSQPPKRRSDVQRTQSRQSLPGTRGLQHRGRMDNTPEVTAFAQKLEDTVIKTVENGGMTKDLALLVGPEQEWLTTEGFLNTVGENFEKAMSAG